jgi:hypothetical protein
LLPVVEAVTGVVRAREQLLGQRLSGDHLPTGGHDEVLELAEEATGIAVRRHDDVLGIELVERADVAVLTEVCAGLGGMRGETPHQPARLERGVDRVEDRTYEPSCGTQLASVTPLNVEAVRA